MENQNYGAQKNSFPVTYAGFWWRFLAYFIDNIIVTAVTSLILFPFILIMGISIFRFGGFDRGFEPGPETLIPFVMIVLFIAFFSKIVEWLYFAIMESSTHQGTLGKIALGIKVTDIQGNRISFARATGRYFGKILSGLVLMIGFIMAGFTEKKQALHDILADCFVIKLQT